MNLKSGYRYHKTFVRTSQKSCYSDVLVACSSFPDEGSCYRNVRTTTVTFLASVNEGLVV